MQPSRFISTNNCSSVKCNINVFTFLKIEYLLYPSIKRRGAYLGLYFDFYLFCVFIGGVYISLSRSGVI